MTAARDGDARAVRRAALVVSTRITLLSALLVLVVAVLAVVYILRVSRPKEDLVPREPGPRIYVDGADMLLVIVVLGAVAIALAGVGSWVIGRRAVRPLGAALALQRAFVADASHELRTPLTVLDTRLQVLQRRPPEGAALQESLAVLRRDTRALIDVVTDLLLIAESGSAAIGSPPPAGTSVDHVVEETAAAMRLVADARGVRLTVEAGSAGLVAVPSTSLRRVLTALLDNAIAHSPAGGVVRLVAEPRKRRVVVTVSDQGPGLRGITPERVFERFARAEPEPTTGGVLGSDLPAVATPDRAGGRGFGLGLALVRDVAVRHGGDVTVASTGPTGTVLRLELPAQVEQVPAGRIRSSPPSAEDGRVDRHGARRAEGEARPGHHEGPGQQHAGEHDQLELGRHEG